MPDQPAHILNLTGGYDYKGFSIRVSYLYQSDKVTGVGLIPFYDSFVDKYDRWDISVQQRLGRMIQLYANFNNITNTHDESLLGYQKLNPTDIQYYGSTIDFGVRFNL
jgi:outer membrane receptor protein involved in Fe transport